MVYGDFGKATNKNSVIIFILNSCALNSWDSQAFICSYVWSEALLLANREIGVCEEGKQDSWKEIVRKKSPFICWGKHCLISSMHIHEQVFSLTLERQTQAVSHFGFPVSVRIDFIIFTSLIEFVAHWRQMTRCFGLHQEAEWSREEIRHSSTAAPKLWNSLLLQRRNALTVCVFKLGPHIHSPPSN